MNVFFSLFLLLSNLCYATSPPKHIGPINTDMETLAEVIGRVHDAYWLPLSLSNVSISQYFAPGHQLTQNIIRNAIPKGYHSNNTDKIKAVLIKIAKHLLSAHLITEHEYTTFCSSVSGYLYREKTYSGQKLGIYEINGGAWNLGEDVITKILKEFAEELVGDHEVITQDMLKYYKALEAKHPLVEDHPAFKSAAEPGQASQKGWVQRNSLYLASIMVSIVIIIVVIVIVIKKKKAKSTEQMAPQYMMSPVMPQYQPPPPVMQQPVQFASQPPSYDQRPVKN